jgi:hypothetical protein
MAGIDLATAQARLDEYLAAELAVLGNQEYMIGSGTAGARRLRRADLAEIRAGIDVWDKRVKDLSNRAQGRGRSVTLRPRF